MRKAEYKLPDEPDVFDAANLVMGIISEGAKPEVRSSTIKKYREIQATASRQDQLWTPEKTILRHIEGLDKNNELPGIISKIEEKLAK